MLMLEGELPWNGLSFGVCVLKKRAGRWPFNGIGECVQHKTDHISHMNSCTCIISLGEYWKNDVNLFFDLQSFSLIWNSGEISKAWLTLRIKY